MIALGEARRRTLLLTQYFPPESGAGARRARAFARFLATKGCDVHVLTAAPNYPMRKLHAGHGRRPVERAAFERAHVTRLRAPGIRFAGLVARSLYEIALALMMLPTAVLRRSDVIVVTVPSPFLLIPAVLARALGRTRTLVVDVRDLTFVYAEGEGGLLARPARLLHRIFCLALRAADTITTAVPDIARSLERAGLAPERLRVLLNGVDEETLTPRSDGRASANGDRPFVRCVYVGLIGRVHGVEAIAEASVHLRSPSIRFLIVGEGPCLGDLTRSIDRAGARDRFDLRGMVPLDDVPGIMREADIAVVTVRDGINALAAKMLDAMAAGVPIVYAGGGEGARLVERARCGVVVPWSDRAAIARALDDLAVDPAGRDAMGRRGREYAEANLMRASLLESVLGPILGPVGAD